MKYIKVNNWCGKNVAGLFVLAVLLLSMAGSSLAEEYTSLNIYPKNVGVFTTDGKQQFIVFGHTATGRENITTQVDWKSSNENIVTIDENGLATIVNGQTAGQVRISCTYPKQSKSQAGPHLLLLLNQPIEDK